MNDHDRAVVLEAVGAYVGKLWQIFQGEHPDVARDRRRQFVQALDATAQLLEEIEIPYAEIADAGDVARRLSAFAWALADLDNGTCDPVLEAAKWDNRPSDPSAVWRVRAMAAAGIEFLKRSGSTFEEAGEIAERDYPELKRLVQTRSALKYSILRWREDLQGRLQETPAAALYRQTVEEADRILPAIAGGRPSQRQYEARGNAFLRQAAELAARLIL